MWLASHVDLAGNVSTDMAAKAALNLLEAQILVPYSGFIRYKYLHLNSLAMAVGY